MWPTLALGAYVYARRLAAAGQTPHLATPHAELLVLAGTVALSAVAWVALRRSSLPGGSRSVADLPPANAVPLVPLDDALIAINWRVGGCLFAWIFGCIVFFVGSTILDPRVLDFTGKVMALYVVLIAAIVGLMAWGPYQARRTPTRVPPAYLALLTLEVVCVLGMMAGLAHQATALHKPLPGSFTFLVFDLVILLALSAAVWARLSTRAKGYAGSR